jgi:hypothetical protein
MWPGVHLPHPVAEVLNIVDWDSNIAEDCPKVFDDTAGVSVEDISSQRIFSLTQSTILSLVRILSATSSGTPSTH